jgi:hypothetical protein
MNLAKTMSLEVAVTKGYPIFVVFDAYTKEIVNWFAFGEKMARVDASDRCAKSGPDTHEFAEWKAYTIIRDAHQRHLDDVAAPWRQR